MSSDLLVFRHAGQARQAFRNNPAAMVIIRDQPGEGINGYG